MIALLLTLAAVPHVQPASQLVVVFVVEPDGSQSEKAAQLEVELAKALEAQSIRLADIDSLFPPAPLPNEGDTLYAAGRLALENLDFEAAQAKLTEALSAYAKSPASTTADRLAEVGVSLASVAAQSGDKSLQRMVQSRLTNAVLFAPTIEPPAGLFGPDLPALMAKIRAELAARPKGTLTIEATPGAHILLRGELRYAPVDPVGGLPTGFHFVAATKAGHLPSAAVVDLKASGSTVSLLNEPTEALADARRAAAALTRQASVQAIQALGKRLGCRYLVVVDAAAGALKAFDAVSGASLQQVSLVASPQSTAMAAQQVKKFIAGPSQPVATAAEVTPGEPVTKKWWFWVAVSGAAVAAGATVGVLAATGPKRGFDPTLGF
jgi:hypothetical protein